MAIEVTALYDDNDERVVRYCDSLDVAIRAAIKLADRYGDDPEDGSSPPTQINVMQNGLLVMPIHVLRGGLLPQKDDRR